MKLGVGVGLRQISSGRVALRSERMEYETLAVSQLRQWVSEVRLNRPDKRNAMNQAFWR